MQPLNIATRNLFFTGKGGVGKTSMACATAVQLADQGHRVLLVSTDPASNLDEVLGTELQQQPTEVPAVPKLWAMNIDPEQAARDYRERMVAPYRGVLPETAIQSMEEQFSGSCTVEIAAFDEFSRLLGDADVTSEFDRVVFDTAPTGHTLRLLTLPSAWSTYVQDNTTGSSCLGPLAGLQKQQQVYLDTVQALSDPLLTTVILVTRPETASLREASRTYSELNHLGIQNHHLIVNGMFLQSIDDSTDASSPSTTGQTSDEVIHDPIAMAMEQRCLSAIERLPKNLASLPQTLVPLQPGSLLGIDCLRNIRLNPQQAEDPVSAAVPTHSKFDSEICTVVGTESHSLNDLVDSLAEQGHGVIMTMGKGGVGKTTVAAAVAVALVDRGLSVHLSTTDPAAHLQEALAHEPCEHLELSRIDPEQVTAAYRDEVLSSTAGDLDERGRRLLEEDLRSPCTEEIAVFRAFAEAVASGTDRIVVLDTAPTGHTILLLDAALAYHREISRQGNQVPESVQQLLPRLRDPEFTRVLIVTLPESTPVHEAARLQQDLRRAEIEPFAWVVNQCLTPLPVQHPVLKGRQESELPWLNEVTSQHAHRTALVPWQTKPPTGLTALRQLVVSDSQRTKDSNHDEST